MIKVKTFSISNKNPKLSPKEELASVINLWIEEYIKHSGNLVVINIETETLGGGYVPLTTLATVWYSEGHAGA